MMTSVLPPSSIGARLPREGRLLTSDGVTPPPTNTSIRVAGLADVPAIARIAQEGPQPVDVEPGVMSRAMRLLLTHVAFEHGALWVEQLDDGSISRAVTAIPAEQLSTPHSALRDVIRQMGTPASPPPEPVFGFGEAFLAEVKSVKPVWLLMEISKASQNPLGDPALLGAALAWARAQAQSAGDPVMVLTDTMPERRAAESLGFVERLTWGRHWPWWLGVEQSVPPGR